jgi:hypothetical protein
LLTQTDFSAFFAIFAKEPKLEASQPTVIHAILGISGLTENRPHQIDAACLAKS